MTGITLARVKELLDQAQQKRLLVVGDVMLDQFIWGRVARISPEAPVPVVDFTYESWMPGGAANVARNLTSLNAPAELVSVIGADGPAETLTGLLRELHIEDRGLIRHRDSRTNIKTRIIAHQQQVVRVDREPKGPLDSETMEEVVAKVEERLGEIDAVIVGDYGKGVITQAILDRLKAMCHERGVWLSLDPKPVHQLDLSNLSLMTPNRQETFQLAGIDDTMRAANPLEDRPLMEAVEKLMSTLKPSVLLITLAELGMLLCRSGLEPFPMPTVKREVSDVSGAGDTVIATFTMIMAAGGTAAEAAEISNHAAGVVVGKLGTASVTPNELIQSFGGG